jgi:peptidase C25-like protein
LTNAWKRGSLGSESKYWSIFKRPIVNSCRWLSNNVNAYFSSLLNGDAENFFGRIVTSQPVEQSAINQQLYRLLFDPNHQALSVGELMRRAKSAANDIDVRRTWILLGDPTMKLR